MNSDPYAPCPCGSGKKFKWCCQPIYAGINHAFQQEAEGQHDNALRIITKVTEEHSGNPEAWGQLARFYFGRGKLEEAEKALDKAFAINSNYPYGLLLRALFRFQEGELPGALVLARKAAEAYAPEAKSYLADVYGIIFECEMKRNRPVAARAALRIVCRGRPEEEELGARFESLFGEQGTLPACARRDYQLLPPPTATGERRVAWDRAFTEAAASPKLARLAPTFEKLAKQDENDCPAWFNLAIVRAWLGDNQAALEAIDRYLALETDDARAETAAALAEVLRCGEGLEEESDYATYSFGLQFRDPQPISDLLQEWHQEQRVIPLPTDQKGVFFAMVLDYGGPSVITSGAAAPKGGQMGGYLLVLGDFLKLWGPNKDNIGKLRESIRQKLNLGLDDAPVQREAVHFEDVVSDALYFPLNVSKEEGTQRVIEHLQKHYEDRWIHQPRRALSGTPPVDAVGHPQLRKKLLGVIRFVQDCAANGMVSAYDFNRLRRKLGLATDAAPAAMAADGKAGPDINAMGAAELAGLSVEGLDVNQLEQAFQTAQRLDAGELAAQFASALVARPVQSGQDRFPVFSYLVQHSLKEGRTDEALARVSEGARLDSEFNEGKRRDDYELRRGQVHVKRGEPEQAADVFQGLIDRVPTNLKYHGSAAEAMLTLKQPARALKFAEDGLAAARQANDRDSEGYLMELVEAAKRQLK